MAWEGYSIVECVNCSCIWQRTFTEEDTLAADLIQCPLCYNKEADENI